MTIILKALAPPLDETKTDDDFGDFIYAPYTEFAIRFFINSFPKETVSCLSEWVSDSNYHVRRLVSEGSRPSLPWAPKVNLSAEETIPLLDTLYADKTQYVTRSVANHMNDLSKKNPELVLETLDKWQKSQKQDPKEMEFILKHSLRTLVKTGNTQAIEFLNFSADPKIEVSDLTLTSLDVPKSLN